MIPSKYANALYFTPRTPWGTRVPRRALRSHMQASEDNPAGKKPIGQKPAPTACTETWRIPQVDPRDRDIVRPYTDPMPQQKVAAANIMATTANPAKYPPSKEQTERDLASVRQVPNQAKGLFGGHFRGSIDYGRDHPKTDRTDGSIEAGFYSNPQLQDQLEKENLRDKPIQPPENGVKPEVILPDVEEEEEE